MANYYFLAASLPELTLGEIPDISFVELKERLQVNLSKKDFAKTVVLRRYIDLHNIRCLLLEENLDPRGNLDEKELDEALLVHHLLPEYVFDFLDENQGLMERMDNFPALLAKFFAEETPRQKGFMKAYLTFEREWRLVMIGLRAKETGRDVVRELQFEVPHDPLVAQILAQKDAKEYDPPAEYEDLKEKLASCGNDPWEKYKVFAAYRFNKIDEMAMEPSFSMDWILSYMARLLIVEAWNALDAKRGREILDTYKAG